MAKEEKPLEYQRRIRDTKGVAQRLDLSYLKRTSLILVLRKQATWIALGVAALVSVPLVLGLGASKRALSTGPLSASHAVFDGRCEVCHSVAFARVKDSACERCHDGAPHPAKSIDTAKPTDTPFCADCHVEHHDQVRLGMVNSGNCTRCHANLDSHATGITIKRKDITAFRDRKHPEFSNAEMKDGRPLKLNHRKHMELDPAKFASFMTRPMQCVDCHKIDPDSPTGNLVLMTFDASCKSCHKRELEFDRFLLLGSPAPISPHTKDQATIREFIRKTYSDALAADPSLASRTLGRDMVASGPADFLEKVTTASYEFLFGQKCTYCHEMESQYEVKKVDPPVPVTLTGPKQLPPGIYGRYPDGKPWLTRSEFSHRSHREVACESCHTAALTSIKTSDVLIPVMKSCLPCHGESRAGLDRCSECHLYHNRSLERERDRRPTEKIIGQLPGAPIVGRTPWSARDPLVPLFPVTAQVLASAKKADEGVGRGPGGPPHRLLARQFSLSQGGPQ